MPRPCKRRRICAEPSCGLFGPKRRGEEGAPAITMTVDEYESIRLIDLEGMTQEQCAQQMGVARTTAQAIYGSARAKLAECLVNEKNLVIAGGDYEICGHGGREHGFHCQMGHEGHCRRNEHCHRRQEWEDRPETGCHRPHEEKRGRGHREPETSDREIVDEKRITGGMQNEDSSNV